MESNNAKILTVSYIVTGVLVGFVLNVLMEAFSAMSGFVARLMASDLADHGVPVVAGAIVFLALQFNPKVNAWGDDVVNELKKVVWPSAKDTRAMTVVVSIMLLISGVVLGFFDFVSSNIVQLIIE